LIGIRDSQFFMVARRSPAEGGASYSQICAGGNSVAPHDGDDARSPAPTAIRSDTDGGLTNKNVTPSLPHSCRPGLKIGVP
jgi:hypothetical protein